MGRALTEGCLLSHTRSLPMSCPGHLQAPTALLWLDGDRASSQLSEDNLGLISFLLRRRVYQQLVEQ